MSRALVPRLRDPREGDRECEDADRDVDEEDPAPPEAVGEEAADEGTAGDRGADRGSPHGKRSEAVGPAVLVTDESERRCEERGAADPLERARHVERRDAPGEAAEERGQREEHDPGDEDQATSVPVGERAGGEDQRGEAERIGVHDPLQARQAGIEALLHVRQRDHDDRDVEQEHERRQADGEKRPLPRTCGCFHPEDAIEAGPGLAARTRRAQPQRRHVACRPQTSHSTGREARLRKSGIGRQ